jgi:hypothetical protein
MVYAQQLFIYLKKNMITNENYFTPNNHGLSQSKIKDYLKDPNYFFRKHIKGEVTTKSDAFTVGGAVDDLLTDLGNLNKGVYVVVSRRNLKNPPVGVIEVNQKQFDEIISIASAVEDTSAWAFIKENFKFQEILQVPADLGEHFNCLVGKPDAYFIDQNDHCWLMDLKTTVSVLPRQYYYNALSYGYFQQMWFYAYLLKQKYTNIKTLSYWHLAVEKKEPFNVELFKIPNYYVDDYAEMMLKVIETIKNDKEFKKKDATFENPTLLKDPKDDSEFEEEL